MPTPTYIPLATKTLTATAASVTFSSISQAYRDLVLVVSVPSSPAPTSSALDIKLNNNTTASYSTVGMTGNGSTAVSTSYANDNYLRADTNGIGVMQINSLVILNFMDYSATDKHKSVLMRVNPGGYYAANATAARWANTSAITSVTCEGGFTSGIVFTLYGIAS